ncbi:MAG: DUF2274 domain-containing protein, partial [Deltaproteobacteria bacterium]
PTSCSQGPTKTRCIHETQADPDVRSGSTQRPVPGELHTALAACASYYQEATGPANEMWPLVLQMLQQFLDTDRDFQAWRRRTQNGPSGGPMAS